MFDKATTRANILFAGFTLDDASQLLELLDESPDEASFRESIQHMRFTGDYRVVYDSDTPRYRALSCIPW